MVSMGFQASAEIVEKVYSILEQVMRCHSPSGAEGEIDQFLRNEVLTFDAKLEGDPAGNLYVALPGKSRERRILFAAHKDELGMMVRTFDKDGIVYSERLNGAEPWVYGEGIVDILGRRQIVSGVLGFGSRHVTAPSPLYRLQTDKVVSWSDARIETKLTVDALTAAGVGVGSRIVVGRSRKSPVRFPDQFVAGYALDNKAAVAALLLLLSTWKGETQYDSWLAFPANEELGGVGAAYLARQIDPTDLIALEILPLSDQCVIENPHVPYLLSKDGHCVYDEELNFEIQDAARRAEIEVDIRTLLRFGSDASIPKKYGQAPRAACLCVPTLNSHGFEMTSLNAIVALGEVVRSFLEQVTSP